MNALMVYATNTGNTYMVASVLLEMLSAKIPVKMKKAADTTKEDVDDSTLLILGSSSWDWQGKRGYPLEEMMDFLKSMEEVDFSGKKIILFGCGDTDYEHFCGALDIIEKFIKDRGGKLAHIPLKIDKYYLNEFENKKKVKEWGEGFMGELVA